ncbi:DUF3710 domain-containing protein [Streptomyces sp. NPDC048606]|uniref:DUF3710 domain-containing protein n=1 Tax=Streptomyces sp. NPDC048606 TaxID=3154726 RepID=UPI003441E517
MSRDETDRLVEVLRGNLSAARVAREGGLLNLEHVLALLVRVIAEEAMTDEEVAFVLASARAMHEEALRSGDLLRPPYRGVDVGPWDVSERGWQALDLLDLGGLRIPHEGVRKVELNACRSGTETEYAEAVLLRDTTAGLQLQAFRTSGEPEWERVCARLEADVRARGGEAERWSGRTGVELRAVIPVARNARGHDSRTVRFIGCDGPGWLLRGVVSGDVALPGSRDDWAYACFENVVVVPSFTARPRAVSLSPTVYAPIAPSKPGRMITLRMPE